MKIGLLVQQFPGGGAEKYVEEIANRLYKDNFDVTVITSENTSSDDSKYGFKIIRLPSLFSLGEYSLWSGLKQALEREKFDLVHSNTYGYYHSDRASRLKKKLGYKLVMTSHGFHGSDLHTLKKKKIIDKASSFDFLREFYDSKIGRKTILAADHLIALSEKEEKRYHSLGVSRSKISIIPPGIKKSFFDKSERKSEKIDGVPSILTIGELSWVKRQSLAIQAIPSLLEKFPKIKLYVIGKNKDQLGQLESLVENLHLQDHVFFLGMLEEDKLISCLRSADILVHTSLAEGLSTILLESMAVGLPFITTPAGGNAELAKASECGIVTPFENPRALSQNLQDLFTGNKLDIMRENTLNYSQNFSWDKLYPQILQIYLNLVNK